MFNMKKVVSAGAALLLAGTISATSAYAGDYPEESIDVIVAFGPGGGTDVAARTIQPFIEKYLGADLVVINKPGAGGEIGFSLLASAKPDGYTIGFINLPAMYGYSYERETAYTPKSFKGVANLVYDPGIIAVPADSDIKDLKQLIQFGIDSPGALPIGTSGSVGSSEHIAILQMQEKTGAKFNHVPFGSTAPLRTALLGGHIPAAAFNLSEAVEYMNEGSLRILGVMANERSEWVPEVPTFKELGIDVVNGSSRGLAVPTGTPEDIVTKLSAAVEKAITDPEYVKKAKSAGVPVKYLNDKDYDQFLLDTSTRLDAIWEKTPWTK
ncbi:Tripartite-type tricarboxylate transporter, receptor component TctC [Cohaesibacter sp. ES.047]|uniref:Bug family tripartite tricarboxylate transporter substrate binding protein n=1 Tax=Cohaesibacter sp. ES.047 TaxID=1798205 RepID=UPI000BBFB968|nr:tripartite tricarboxylate transporter substrate binding protein [Cohaesibacter sp. ES.047]SNY93376.1 Tripartite-type tricarboxylate transporter, receptor component TctC [Cohaesibacter sp. ES.047]